MEFLNCIFTQEQKKNNKNNGGTEWGFLKQMVNSPTRGDNILDLVMTNRIDAEVRESLGSSDHLFFSCRTEKSYTRTKV